MSPVFGEKAPIASPLRHVTSVQDAPKRIDESGSMTSTITSAAEAEVAPKKTIAPRRDAWLWFPTDGAREHSPDVLPGTHSRPLSPTRACRGEGEVLTEGSTDFACRPNGGAGEGGDDRSSPTPTIDRDHTALGRDSPTAMLHNSQDTEATWSVTTLSDERGSYVYGGGGERLSPSRRGEVVEENKIVEEIQVALSQERKYANTNFTELRKYQIHKEYALNDTAYEILCVRIKYVSGGYSPCVQRVMT